jgi:hypothetical protein
MLMQRFYYACFCWFLWLFQTAVPGSMLPSAMNLSGQDSAVQLFEQALALMQRNPFKKEVDWIHWCYGPWPVVRSHHLPGCLPRDQ